MVFLATLTSDVFNTSTIISDVSGTASVVVTYPFDIMRTQFALQGKNVVFKSMASFIAHTYRTTGVKGKASTLIERTL